MDTNINLNFLNMKFETALLTFSLIGTFVNWSLIYQYQLKRKILLSILSIPFGFVGLLFIIVIGSERLLEYVTADEVTDYKKMSLVLSLCFTVLTILFLIDFYYGH